MKKAVLTFICFVILLGAMGAAAIPQPIEQPTPPDMVAAQIQLSANDVSLPYELAAPAALSALAD